MSVLPQIDGNNQCINLAAITKYFQEPSKYQFVLRNGKDRREIHVVEQKDIGLCEQFWSCCFDCDNSSLEDVVTVAIELVASKKVHGPIEKAVSLLAQKNNDTIRLQFSTAEDFIEFFPYIEHETHWVVKRIFSEENVPPALLDSIFTAVIQKRRQDIVNFFRQHSIKNQAGFSILFKLWSFPKEVASHFEAIINALVEDEIRSFERACHAGSIAHIQFCFSSENFIKTLEQRYVNSRNIFHQLATSSFFQQKDFDVFVEAAKHVPHFLQAKNIKGQTPLSLLRQNPEILSRFLKEVLSNKAIKPEEKAFLILGPELSSHFKTLDADPFQRRLAALCTEFTSFVKTKNWPASDPQSDEIVLSCLLLEKYAHASTIHSINLLALKDELRHFSFPGFFSAHFVTEKLVSELRALAALAPELKNEKILKHIIATYDKILTTYAEGKRSIAENDALKMAWSQYDIEQIAAPIFSSHHSWQEDDASSRWLLFQAYCERKDTFIFLTQNILGEGTYKKVQEALEVVLPQEHHEIVAFQKTKSNGFTFQEVNKQKKILQELISLQKQDPCPFLLNMHQVLDFENNTFAIVTEVCDKSFSSLFHEHNFQPSQEKSLTSMLQRTLVLYDFFTAVAWLHKYGFSHRDLMTRNVLLKLDKKGLFRGRLGDLEGACKIEDLENRANFASYVSPIPGYSFSGGATPPEVYDPTKRQVLKEFDSSYLQSCDLWGMGISCHELLYKRTPCYVRQLENQIYKSATNLPVSRRVFMDLVESTKNKILQLKASLSPKNSHDDNYELQGIHFIQMNLCDLYLSLAKASLDNPVCATSRLSAKDAASVLAQLIKAVLDRDSANGFHLPFSFFALHDEFSKVKVQSNFSFPALNSRPIINPWISSF